MSDAETTGHESILPPGQDLPQDGQGQTLEALVSESAEPRGRELGSSSVAADGTIHSDRARRQDAFAFGYQHRGTAARAGIAAM